MPEGLGIDLGGVVIAEIWGMSWVPLSLPTFRRVQPIATAKESIARLVERFGKERIHIVSQCRGFHRDRALEWLEHHGFVPELFTIERIHFCDRWQEKVAICAELGITHFVDNKPQVLRSLDGVPNKHLFRSWPEALRALA